MEATQDTPLKEVTDRLAVLEEQLQEEIHGRKLDRLIIEEYRKALDASNLRAASLIAELTLAKQSAG